MIAAQTRELAVIAAITAVIESGRDPDHLPLYRALKDAHQMAHGQLAQLAGRARANRVAASVASTVLTLEARLAELLGPRMTLASLRFVEHHLGDSYGDDTTVHRALRDAAKRRWCVITAHLARRGDPKLESELPHPLHVYFVDGGRQVCDCCVLDRPGTSEPLAWSDPHAYVCRGCHDEALRQLPAELVARWPERTRRTRALEKALGRPAKQHAREVIHAVLAGQPADQTPARVKLRIDPRPVPRAPESRSTLAGSDDGATPSERAYTDGLFDYRTLRSRW